MKKCEDRNWKRVFSQGVIFISTIVLQKSQFPSLKINITAGLKSSGLSLHCQRRGFFCSDSFNGFVKILYIGCHQLFGTFNYGEGRCINYWFVELTQTNALLLRRSRISFKPNNFQFQTRTVHRASRLEILLNTYRVAIYSTLKIVA